MKGSKIIFSFVLLVSTMLTGSAQEQNPKKPADVLLEKVQQASINSETYGIRLQFNLYPSKESTQPIESYDGILVKDGTRVYQKIHHTEFFSSKHGLLKVNHDQKMAALSRGLTPFDNPLDFEKYRTLFPERELKDEGSMYVITLNSLPVTPLPYAKIEVFVSKGSNKLLKQVLHFINPIDYPDKDGRTQAQYPRLEIVVDQKEVAVENFRDKLDFISTLSKSNDTVVLTGALKDYTLIKN